MKEREIFISFVVITWNLSGALRHLLPQLSDESNVLRDSTAEALKLITAATSSAECSVILFSDGNVPPISLTKGRTWIEAPAGFGIFDTGGFEDIIFLNTSDLQSRLLSVLKEARKIRRASKCLTVVLLSGSLKFLEDFANACSKGRLLVWSTKLLVLTRLPAQKEMKDLVTSHWTFSMMNTMIITPEKITATKLGIFSYLPYSPKGPRLEKVALWTRETGLVLLSKSGLFPPKFANFHGQQVNITALPYSPYWREVQTKGPNGETTVALSGTDYFMLEAISKALNFTFYNIPTNDWDEVTNKVVERKSFIAAIIYAVLPDRLDQYDYSYAFEFANPTFCLTKPVLEPQWQSLYYPLTDGVWLAILASLILVPVAFYMMGYVTSLETGKRASFSLVVEAVIGLLLGQDLSRALPNTGSSRLLMLTWLIFSFIIGAAYRGNLTAYLTLPKYPPRAETLEQLIKVADKVTMPPYGIAFRDFYKSSDSPVFQKLASIWETVPTGEEGLQRVTMNREAHIQVRRYLELLIAEHFTKADGSTDLYLGQQSVIPGLSGWPIPHDAPFKPVLDRCIMAVKEAGLYEKWSQDVMAEVRKESQERQRRALKEAGGDVSTSISSESQANEALTIAHMQGALMLMVLGLVLGILAFITEVLIFKCLDS